MAKKDKNSLLNIHYSRTLTPDNLSKAANYAGEYFLKGLGTLGRFLNAGFTSPTYGTTGQVSYARNAEDTRRQKKLYEASELAAGKAMTWVSPLNYGAALWNGHGLDARKGEEEVASWSPAWQAVGRLGELYAGPKAVKGVKATPKAVVNTTAKAGVKPAKAAVVAREINKGIKLNTKNGRIEVTENYFNSPDKWYRITETPEKYGIMELGKNVTTHDASQTYGTINGWRSSMLRAPIIKSSEGFIKRPQKIELNIRRKNGQAHGNTSQAAKGKLWGGTTSGSNLFPEGIIEGQAPSMINYGIDRTNFVITPWQLVPNGGRVGFHTGEMPMSNLGWFQRTNKGTYTYEPIILEKRIEIKPSTKLKRVISERTYPWYRGKQYSVKEVVNSDGTVNPRQAMKILHEVSEQFPGSYKMEYRLENPEWHQNDPTTYQHTKNVALSAWRLNVPYGFTKHDLMVTALGHDFGKIVAGDGHAQIGADLAKQVFPDLTDAQYKAIVEHMGTPKTPLGKATKAADIDNGRGVIRRSEDTGNEINISPEELYKVLKDQELNGYYFMGHGTGRTNVNPLVIFDNGLRIKNGDIGNTTVPISLSNLSLWPHANSKEIIILPGRAGNVKFDSAHGHIPSDWYDSKTFQWDDNPGFEGSGLFAVQKPNATFVETEINRVPGVYTKPEAILGSYNINTLTLRLNPNSQYKFQFGKTTSQIAEKNVVSKTPNIIRTVLDNGKKIRLSLPSHTNSNPRQFVLEPLGNNKFYVHMRTWDGDHIPANLTNAEKQQLFNALYNELPEGAEILFPKSGPGNYGTRGTVAGLQRLSRDPRFTPGTKGILQYYDKDGKTIKTYEGTSFIKAPKLQYLKQGGKMNTLEFLKKGSGIHIKEKNKGKFTSYCGGKVTDECIRKAKASGNPTLVKRATFADNARHFKHRLGGSIVEAFKLKRGGKAFHPGVNISDSNPNAYKDVKKKYKMHLFGGVFNSLDNPNAFGGVYAEMMLGRRYDELLRELKKQKELLEALKKAQELELENLKTNSLLDVLSGVVQNKDWIVDLFNKNKKPSISMNGSSIITEKPNFSNLVITTESGMSGTVDDWRKAILG